MRASPCLVSPAGVVDKRRRQRSPSFIMGLNAGPPLAGRPRHFCQGGCTIKSVWRPRANDARLSLKAGHERAKVLKSPAAPEGFFLPLQPIDIIRVAVDRRGHWGGQFSGPQRLVEARQRVCASRLPPASQSAPAASLLGITKNPDQTTGRCLAGGLETRTASGGTGAVEWVAVLPS